MSIDYYSNEGIGIVIDDSDELISNIKQKMVEQYEKENGQIDEDELDDFEPSFDDFFSEDEDIVYHAGGNFVADRQLVHMFVCPGQTLKEQIENIPKFLQAMNKYMPLTEDELNTVSVWSVM